MEAKGRPCPLGPESTWLEYYELFDSDRAECERRVAEAVRLDPDLERRAFDLAAEPLPATPTERASAPQPDRLDLLKSLAELHRQGVLTDDEFAAQKARILSV